MASFGDTLKRERELREITLREISDATKINIRYLEALEQNRFDALPGGLFNKGFIRAYSTYIGVDGEAMVTCYLQEIATRASGSASGTDAEARGVHRPAETPRRRAAPPREEEGGNGRPLAITLAEPSAEVAAPAPHGPAFPPPAPEAAPARPASVTGIDEAPQPDSSSRVLPGILGAVGAAAAVFVILSLILRHPDGRAPSRPGPPTSNGPQDTTGDAGAPPALLAAGNGAAAPAHGAAPHAPMSAGIPISAPVEAPPPVLEPSTPSHAPWSQASPPAGSTSGSGPMHLTVQATERTWVQLHCDAREEINWVMRAGDSEAFECLGLIQVNAADAGAVRLTVDGAPCAPLGEAGSRVHGYTIRSDDFRQICPARGRGDDGHP